MEQTVSTIDEEWRIEKRAELVQGLRDAADTLESCPLDMLPYNIDINVSVTEYKDGNIDIEATQRNLAKAARWLRNVTKNYDDYYFTLRREFGSRVRIEICASRSSVCKKVKTGVRFVPAKQVEEYEYQCDPISFLGMEE
jgi:hypothetical protein